MANEYGRNYMVPINEPDGEDGSVTCDVVNLVGSKKQRKKQWRKYLEVRTGVWNINEVSKITRAMGFKELL